MKNLILKSMIILKGLFAAIAVFMTLFSYVPAYSQDLGSNDIQNDKQSLVSNDFEYGLTIINHGAQFFGSNPFGWMIEMAEAIRIRAGQASILQYNKSTGNFDELPGYDLGGETILIFDWVSESDNFAEGFSEAAADALFAALLLAEQNGLFVLQNIHFIGHSRGCSVNSEIVERLLKIGVEVEQVTNLDAHDWGAFTLSNDYDVNPDTLIIDEPASRSPNRGIVAWEGIGWSDSYWQTAGLAGRSVYGTYSLQLASIGHSEVHEWYLGTIDNSSGDNSWYGGSYPERSESGFNYSRIGGLTRPAEWGGRTQIIFDFENDGIVNGDFERGPVSNFDQYPGWSEHGGGGNGNFNNNRLVLDQNNYNREHNRFYIPNNANKLNFLFRINTAESGIPPETDKFRFFVKTNGSQYLLFEEFTIAELEKIVEIDITDYQNSIATILFELQDGGGNGINSSLEVDDVSIVLDSRIKIDISVFLAGAYQNGQMNTGLGDIPLNQPYNVPPWNYNGEESVSNIPQGAVDWVLIELRDKIDGSTILGRRAGFLLESGRIVDLDGKNPVAYSLPPDYYYISVKHRNHLSAMSSNPVEISVPK